MLRYHFAVALDRYVHVCNQTHFISFDLSRTVIQLIRRDGDAPGGRRKWSDEEGAETGNE